MTLIKYYFLLLVISIACSCNNQKEEDLLQNTNREKLERCDTISFDGLIKIENTEILPVDFLNKYGKEKTSFSLNDTFRIKIEYRPQALNNKNYRFSIKPISKGFVLIKSLSENVFLATINDKDVNNHTNENEVHSVFDVFIESDDICFKVKDRQNQVYFVHKQKLRQKILKFKIDTLSL
ncbi:MAG: hypothetical protein WED10_14540 [Brumimicrobium sp.]|uniref:Lipoprotein n=1 Tax=Brumimicrobium salinarum TaxID=2058658 RepID=A0A2I0R1X6_9FLAO|nr:hypothetical protein [Brumimicrobium salinarum]PKR80584.1 hypothetical protein CW751_09425 [Brumimicrobium salinarum]